MKRNNLARAGAWLAVVLALIFSARASAPPRGADRLRELIVFPQMKLNFSFGLSFAENAWGMSQSEDEAAEIIQLRARLNQQPGDARQLLHLGDLLDDEGDTNGSLACYEKVASLCRTKAGTNPQDGANLTLFANALDALGERDAAEKEFRLATVVSPKEWWCWVILGNYLAKDATLSLFPESARGAAFPNGQAPPQALLDYHPAAAALTKSEAECTEAARCFDRAVAVAPQEAEVFFQRAGYMSISNWFNGFSRHFRNQETISPTAWSLAFFSQQTAADLHRAADLNPENYSYISLAAYFDWLHATLLANGDPANWPDKTRQSIQNSMTRLETLAQKPDKQLAAAAAENLGMVNFIFGNGTAAATNFRRAVALDPTRAQSWEMLIGTQMKTASTPEITALCEARLKYDASARNHLLLARSLEHEKKWAGAALETAAALKLDPKSLTIRMELAALALAQSDQPDFLGIAGAQLAGLQQYLDRIKGRDDYWVNWRELTLNMAIFDGLSADPAAAKTCLDRVAKYFPNDTQARAIAGALN